MHYVGIICNMGNGAVMCEGNVREFLSAGE